MNSNPTMSTVLANMELERLDSEIEKSRKHFYSAVMGKKRRVKRTWLEISALTNAHLLQLLPYRAMLGHVAKLAEERDKLIEDMLATKESSNQQDESNDKSSQDLQTHFARDEAVQTEESSFSTTG